MFDLNINAGGVTIYANGLLKSKNYLYIYKDGHVIGHILFENVKFKYIKTIDKTLKVYNLEQKIAY